MYGSNGSKNMNVTPWVKSLKLKNPFIHPFSVLFLFSSVFPFTMNHRTIIGTLKNEPSLYTT